MTALALVLPLAGVMTVLPAAPAAAADVPPYITLAKEGPSQILVGDTATYTLTATNPTATGQRPQYNASFRDVLPPGLTYQGPTTPAGVGDPTVVTIKPSATDQTTWYQVLTWSNVADLQVGSATSLTFTVRADKTPLPVSSSFVNNANVYTNEDARYVPKFDASGTVVANSYTEAAAASSGATGVTAFGITKSSAPNPEGELPRGIHAHVATYTLEVTNNPSYATHAITIVDYLPAGLEFLGCGEVDNTTETATYPDAVEYPGAPGLAATPAVADCVVPDSVETVELAAGNPAGLVAGVYTRVSWSLGDFAASAVKRIVYEAGIPQRANTTDWQGAEPPSVTGGGTTSTQPPQTANLDNNTGPATRETTTEQALTNGVVGNGSYTGPVPGQPSPTPVTSTTKHTVTAEDLAMQKSVSPTTFVAGDIATYTLALETSEYVTADQIVITDVLPNGVCPLSDDPATNHLSGSTAPDPSCDGEAGAGPRIDGDAVEYTSVSQNPDGTFTVVFPAIAEMPANGIITVTYGARMRTVYTGGSMVGQPTSAGDTYTNNASLTGRTTTPASVNPPDPAGELTVHDDSSATQSSTQPAIDKRIKPNVSGSAGYRCDAGTGDFVAGEPVSAAGAAEYVDPATVTPPLTDAQKTFRNGSIVCFLLRVEFPSQSQTRNPVITDFVPAGTTYVPDSQVVTDRSTLRDAEVSFSAASGNPVWTVGTVQGSNRFAPKGAVFEVVLAVTVDDPASGTTPDIVGNLMKYRSENSAGQAISLRDQLDLQIAPLPPVSLVKGIASITSAVGGAVQNVNLPPAAATNTDGLTVRDGDTVRFRIDVTNTSSTLAPAHRSSVRTLDIWDKLPAGSTCSQIGNPSPGNDAAAGVSFACLNPADTGYPASMVGSDRSLVRWTFDTSDANAVDPGATKILTYDYLVPDNVSVAAVLTDDAGVRSYQAWTNVRNVAATYYPASNIDTSLCADGTTPTCEAPSAKDPSNVKVVNVALTKTGVTSIEESNNNRANQATIGELVTYTVTATVPYGGSVYRGVMTDTLPPQVVFQSATADFSSDGGSTWGPTPGGVAPAVAGTVATGQTVTLSLPTSYTAAADSSTDHVFRMVITARVGTDATNAQGVTRTNRVSFLSKSADSPSAGNVTAPTARTYSVSIVEPSPTLDKAAAPTQDLVVGDRITYTLTARNSDGRPPLHNTWVVDCVPAGLTFLGFLPADRVDASAVDGDGSNGCLTGQKRIAWQPASPDPTPPAAALPAGTLLAGAANQATLAYRAEVSAQSAGLTAYTNNADLTGGTLHDAGQTSPSSPPNPDERTYTDPASATVTVKGGTITKTVVPTAATIGETATWTITATLPAKVNFYQASVIDQVEQGIDISSVSTQSVTCVDASGDACAVLTGVLAAAPAPTPSTATLIGWYLGDVGQSDEVRTVTIVYSAKVADVDAAKRGNQLLDTATLRWDSVDKPGAPGSAGATFERSSDPATALLTVREPLVSIEKSVSDTTPDPGQSFTYTVVVRNSAAANVSTAFDVRVQDVIPDGVVVRAGTISGSGTIAPQPIPSTGGGTISWPTIPSIAPGGSVTFTYQATLAPSATLTAAGKLNTASVAGYNSLADDAGRPYAGPSSTQTVTPQFPRVTPSKSTPNGDVAYVGDPFTWQLTLRNTGASRAFGVDAVDTLPPNWSYTATQSVSVAGAVLAPAPAPTLGTSGTGAQTLTWTDLGAIDPGQTIVISFTATPQAGAAANPGVTTPTGTRVPHTNTLATTAEDATGAQGSAAGPYNAGPATAPAYLHSADLVLDKSHTGSPVAGSEFAWTVTVTNNGPDPATGPFTVVDTVAAPMTYAGATGTGWTCSATGSAVTCTRGNGADTLAPGASFPDITLRVTIPSDQTLPTTLSNTATVTGKTHDPNPGNNTDTDTAGLTASADLRIVKARSGPLVAGQDVTYTLDVSNLGPSTSRATISVSDPVPAGTTFVSARGTGWTCPPDGAAIGTIACTRAADLPAGEAAQRITVVLHVSSGFTGSLANTATVTGPTPDPVPGNNTSTVTAPVATSADVAIEKTHSGPFTPGTADNSYTFQIANFGPSDAAAPVRVVDELPAFLSWTGAKTDVSGQWSCTATPTSAPTAPDRQTVTCTLTGGLASGQTRTVRLGIAVANGGDASGTFVNTATVSSGTPDPNPANNSSTNRTDYDSLADLTIAKSPATQTVVAGEQATWTLVAGNAGPSDSVGPTTVVDVLPSGASLDSATGTGWSCDADPDHPNVVTCTHADGIADGGTLPTITVVADIAPSAGPATLVNVASVDGPTPDLDLTNNHDSADLTVADEADLGIVKAFTGTDPVAAGATTTFSLTVSNNGPSDADDLVVSDELPAGLSYVSATGTGWSCDAVGQVVTCTRPGLPAESPLPTQAPPITLTVRVDSGSPSRTVTNTARISSGTTDRNPDNDSSSDSFDVVTSADLVLVKTHDEDATPVAGQPFTFLLTATNEGPSDALAPIVVSDHLPAGLSYVSNGPGWACTTSGSPAVDQVVTCTRDGDEPLIAGTSAPVLTITTLIAADTDPGGLANTATVTSPTPDPDVDNNTAVDPIDVTTLANLVVTKSHTAGATVGGELAFTLGVSNDGPSEARTVTLVDTLPPGLTYVSATGPGWTCTMTGAADGAADGPKVTCALADPLPPKEAAPPVTLTVKVGPAAYPTAENVVVGATATPESSTADNRATDTVTVPPLVDLAIDKSHTGSFTVGTNGTYLLTVTNDGPTSDPGPQTITDTLPTGLGFVSGTGEGWTCSASGATVTCERRAALAVGASTSVALVVSVGPAAAPSVVNTATVATPSKETTTANNSDSDLTEVTPVSVLTIRKEAVDVDGDQVTYEITVGNTGPNATSVPIVVSDPLPRGLEFVSVSGDGWQCTEGRTVTCTYAASLAVGASASFELVTTMTAAPGTEIVNVATLVSGGEGEVSDEEAVLSPDSDGGADSGSGSGGLADTGANVARTVTLALLLMLLGSFAVQRGRRANHRV